jgi:hypothetical protein
VCTLLETVHHGYFHVHHYHQGRRIADKAHEDSERGKTERLSKSVTIQHGNGQASGKFELEL